MGKPGGFFKRLKNKQKKQQKRDSRGTTGASKVERKRKRAIQTEYFAARRQVEKLDEISDSSESDVDVASEAESEDNLAKLRVSLGVGSGAAAAPLSPSLFKAEDEDVDLEDIDALMADEEEEDGELLGDAEEDDEVDEEEFEEADDDGSFGDDGLNSEERAELEAMEESDEDDEEFEEMEESDFDDDDEDEEGDFEEDDEEDDNPEGLQEYEVDESMLMQQAQDDDLFVFDAEEAEEDEEEFEDDDEDEAVADFDADGDGEFDDIPEDAFQDEDDEDAPRADVDDEKRLMLKGFEYGATSAESLAGVVEPSDPWFIKYHLDGDGEVDGSRLAEPKQRPAALVDEEIAVKLSTAAKRRQKLLLTPTPNFTNRPAQIHTFLWEKWVAFRERQEKPIFTDFEWTRFNALSTYADLQDATGSFESAQSTLEVTLLHLLNHWMKARSVVIAHNQILTNVRDAGDDEDDLELRDRGFGKTRGLLMLPMRHGALLAVQTLIDIMGLERHEQHQYRMFESDFSEVEENMDPTFKRRPLEYRKQFEGNIDDTFCFGLNIKPNRVGIYSHVLNSDLIICSPLGLRKRMQKSADCSVALSSIEVTAVLDAHVIMVQNWQHIEHVLRMLNRRPKDTTEGLSEISRIYSWSLEGQGARHRQTIMVSHFTHATINATCRSFCNNSGRIVWTKAHYPGVLSSVTQPIRQHFVRFDASEFDNTDDERFEFFVKHVYPSKIQPLVERNVRTIIVVPSYFDYVRVRNFFISEHRENFCELNEYTTLKQQRKSLGQFSDLECPVLITTERFYFFKRYFVKMAECLVFYSPPVFANFYPQLISKLVHTSPNVSVLTLFCRFDSLELTRLVGNERALQLLTRDAEAFAFVTGS